MQIRKHFLTAAFAASLFAVAMSRDGLAQRGNRGGGGGKSAGNRAPNAAAHQHAGPAMTRPAPSPGGGGHQGVGKAGGGAPAVAKNASGANRLNIGGGDRPNAGGVNRPNVGGNHPAAGNAPGNFHRPSAAGPAAGTGAGLPRPGANPGGPAGNVGVANRPANVQRPGGGASSSQVNDFLGLGGKGESGGITRPNVGNVDRPAIGQGNLPGIGKGDPPGIRDNVPGVAKNLNPNDRRPDVDVGNVNVGNSVNYSKNQQAWINNQHNTGNLVRTNAGNRYYAPYNSGLYRRGAVGGYPYYGGWANRGPYYGWTAASYATLGTFMGASWANAQPAYYAYGAGGNVHYEDNTVYVNDQPAGTPEQYTQQMQAAVAAAPATATDGDWLPLGAFAFTREGVDDSQGMIELAVNKQGVVAGTYYNEATGVSRSLKGTLDRNTQRVAIGFADGKNTDVVLETGIYNLTQDEAPGMLHYGTAETQPVLLVRLQPPADKAAGQ